MLLIPPSAAVEVGTAPSTAAGGVHHPTEAARGRGSAGEDSDVIRRRTCPRHVEVALSVWSLSLVSTKEKYTSIIRNKDSYTAEWSMSVLLYVIISITDGSLCKQRFNHVQTATEGSFKVQFLYLYLCTRVFPF